MDGSQSPFPIPYDYEFSGQHQPICHCRAGARVLGYSLHVINQSATIFGGARLQPLCCPAGGARHVQCLERPPVYAAAERSDDADDRADPGPQILVHRAVLPASVGV